MLGGLGAEEPPAPQYYRVTCPQGHALRGQRTDGYQAIRCPGCGEGVFILPRSPLPEPPAPAVERPRTKSTRPEPVVEEEIRWTDPEPEIEIGEAASQVGPEVEIQWEDEATPPARSAPPAFPARDRATGSSAPMRPTARRTAEAPAERAPRQTERERAEAPRGRIALPPRPTLGERLRRRRHQLIVASVLLFLAATVSFRVYQRRWEQLPEIAKTNRDEGLEALRQGVFDTAKQRLAIAADALETLRDPGASQVRQAADEAAIFADLAGLSLEEMVEDVATRGDGAARFDQLYKGRSILIDGQTAVTRRGAPTVDYRIYASGKRGWIDLTDFRLLQGKPEGTPVTFGARLGSIALDETGQWRITLEPDSGVYLSTEEAWEGLATLGWPDRSMPLEDLP